MGGRGLCNGEHGLQLELQRTVETPRTTGTSSSSSSDTVIPSLSFEVLKKAFEKELVGIGILCSEATPVVKCSEDLIHLKCLTTKDLFPSFIEKQPTRNWGSDYDSEPPLPSTKSKWDYIGQLGLHQDGGIPSGEKGLKSFIEKQPTRNWGSDYDSKPPLPSTKSKWDYIEQLGLHQVVCPVYPSRPMFIWTDGEDFYPSMIATVKNPNNHFYMYCGIIQRITDGKARVLFEGGN
ncbi:hypothetical protein NE237_025141 [Protea cynaroides]|uniref:Uncharacterized protein n=1 Tax=Protea cynaroides TaxID=273540 RepID=A0A9Q0H4P0_9MAGN|nr:hypothetical protein NE237_025141 [Protea cynaroides]